jgi:hypothetical protein
LIFGGTLTSSAGKFGTKGLGDVHADKLQVALAARNDEVLDILNDTTDFRWKLKKFYPNLPDNLHFDTNRTKEYTIDEIKMLSDSVTENGQKLTKRFFTKFGLEEEDIEDMPIPVKTGNFESDDSTMSVTIAKPERGLFGVKKKSF